MTGELSFADPIALPTGTNPEAMTTADLDGDGLMDLVTADFADWTVTVRYGTGDGQFSGSHHHFVGQGPVDVVAADLDGRYGLDLITANMLTGDVSVLLSTGQRMFAEEAHYQTGEFTSGVSVADLNADGLPGHPGRIRRCRIHWQVVAVDGQSHRSWDFLATGHDYREVGGDLRCGGTL